MRKITCLFFGLSLLFGCAESELPLKFSHLLGRAKMIFIEPDGYKRIDSIRNNMINCDLAYMHPNKKFEVRYAIHPMDIALKEYKQQVSELDSVKNQIHPDKLYNSTFKAALQNISDGQSREYTVLSPTGAKTEFNADWGATAIVNIGNEFGNEYKYCHFVFIHKNNIGDAFIFGLSDDLKLLNNEMKKVAYSLRFSY